MSLSGNKLAEPIPSLMKMADRLAPVPETLVSLADASGLVLAREVVADRDHPSIDISAVDGYAVRFDQAGVGRHSIAAESRIGFAPPAMAAGGVVKIVTGAPVPAGAEAIVRREEVSEHPDFIEITGPLSLKPDQDIRRRGTNIHAGEHALSGGIVLGPQHLAAMASLGVARAPVRRRVRVALIVTGDELVAVDHDPKPWQIRESHSYAIRGMLEAVRWLSLEAISTVSDELPLITQRLSEVLTRCDAVILTGGVSMGDRDFVPAAVRQVGAQVVYHGLALRPGRPMLGAVGREGQAILGLPGNPLSVLVTLRRLGSIALRKLAGVREIDPPAPRVSLIERAKPHPSLWVFPTAVIAPDGSARVIAARNSGDLVTAAQADGFVEIPPGDTAPESVSFYPWSLA